MYEEVRSAARAALLELLDAAALKPGQQVVIGCSSSEIMGQKIGKGSTPEAAKAVVDEILPILNERGLYLEAQCCEHLNRALIMERAAAEKFGYEIVCVRPRPKAGGSFATAVYEAMDDPVAVEFVKADARPRYRQYHDRYAPQARGCPAAPVGQDDRRGGGQRSTHQTEAHRRQPCGIPGLITL